MRSLVVIDDGHTATKVVWRQGEEAEAFVFPSKAILGVAEVVGGEVHGADVYFVDQKLKPRPNQIYTLYGREHPITVDNRFEDFPKSKQNRVLVHHALVRSGVTGSVDIITTIPVRDYFKPSSPSGANDALTAAKNENVTGKCYRRDALTGEGEEPYYEIDDALVFPEGVYAIYDVAFSDTPSGEELDAFQSKYFSGNTSFAVIDIGGKTTDVIIAEWNCSDASFTVDIQKTKTMRIGVMDVAIALEREVERRFDVSNLSFDALDLLASGKITISGVIHDITDIVQDAVALVGGRISDMIAPLLDGYRQFGVMVFCGGGAALFRDIAAKYPSTVVHTPEDPQFSNAMGIMKFRTAYEQSLEGQGDDA